MKRTVTLLGTGLCSLGLLALSGVPGSPASASARSTRTAVARPFVRIDRNDRSTTPPTTAQCKAEYGIACYQPSQIQTAYDMGPLYAKSLTGTGETIALIDSYGSPTITSDLATFDKGFGLAAPPSFSIIAPEGTIPAYNPNNATMVGWAEETTLDVEYSHAMAPGASILLVETPVAETIGVQGFPQIVAAENYVINNSLAQVISQSFGAAEQTFPTTKSLLNLRSAYVNAQKHDVTVLAASGDDGSTSGSNATGSMFFTTPVVNWPASDPLVTAVGGTELHLTATGARTQPDSVWNDTATEGFPAASGGGVSSVFARPTWQKAVSGTVGAHRGMPDLALSAAISGSVLIYASFGGVTPGYYPIAGTSEASPLFSGVVAIADQAAGHPLGFLNPTLYRLEAAGDPGIVDVTTGTNTVTFSQGGTSHTVAGYAAGPGYDLSSGLGTVDGSDLVTELAAGSA